MTGLIADLSTLTSVVERASAGDENAFARLVAAYQLDLVRVAFVVTGDPALAEEAAEAAWWIAWRKLPGLREPVRVRGWLVAVAANEARKLVARRHRRSVMELRLADLDPPDNAGQNIDRLDLANALGRLAPADRTLVALRYAADLESDEIAPLFHMTASGVRSRLGRVLRRLRKDLEHE
jgi:RNA polymerase sigma-70 factor (ECF subfamily)